jgi:hypothetical protein
MSDDRQSPEDTTLASVLAEFAIPEKPSLGNRILRFIRREPLGFLAILVIGGLIFMSAAAPIKILQHFQRMFLKHRVQNIISEQTGKVETYGHEYFTADVFL